MNAGDPGRNLLFGLLALQNSFIDRRALLAAFDEWTHDKSRALGRIMADQGVISPELFALIEGLVSAHLSLHGNDPERSLGALTPIGSVKDDLRALADPQSIATLAQIATDRDDADPFATEVPSVGVSASERIRFQILRPLNKGGMGIVSVARDTELDRIIALKEITGDAANNSEYRARFLAEAEITGKLEHPGIIPIYGLGTYGDGRPFYAMRLIRGDKTGSLMDAIVRFHAEPDVSSRVVEFRGLLRRFLDVCNAVDYAHSKGVLHRDLKPNNILLGPYGETLVVDWGLAKVLGRAEPSEEFDSEHVRLNLSGSDVTPTQAGGAYGTPEYAPPEQMTGDLANIGPRSDVYGLGAVLYCLMTGQAPFSRKGIDFGALIRKIEAGDFTPPRKVRPDIDKSLEAICLKALQTQPANRYESVGALAADVDLYLAEEPVSVYRDPWKARAGRWARKHRTAVGSVATFLLVASAASVVALFVVSGKNRLLEQRESEAKEQADLARRRLYDAKMIMTQRAYNDGDAELFRRLLNEQNNEEHAGADRRSFEWGFWTHRDRASSRIWRPNRGQGLSDRITGTAFSADGKWLGVAWINGLSIGSIEDRAPRFELEQEQPFFGLSISPDRRWVTSGHGAEYYVWGVGDRKLRAQFVGSSSSFLPDGRLVALEGSGVVIRDLDDDARTQRIPTATHSVIASSVDGKRIATADNAPTDGRETVQVWNVADSSLIATFTGDSKPKFSGLGAPKLGVSDVAFSRDGRSCAMSGARRIFIWDIDGQKVRQIIDTGAEPASELDFSPDGRLLAVGGGSVSDVIYLYDIESGRVVRRLFGHEGHVSGIEFSPDGRYLSSGDDTGEVRLWDLEVEPAFKIRFDGKDHITSALEHEFCFGPEDRWLAVCGGVRGVLCDPSANGILATLNGVGSAMALSEDGKTLVTSDRNDSALLLVWDLTYPESPVLTKVRDASPYPVIGKGDSNSRKTLPGIESIAFAADGRSVVIGRRGRLVGSHGIVVMEGLGGSPVRRLDLKTGDALWTTFAHREDLERIALSPDSAKLATSSMNEGTFKIIDATTGREERSVKAHDGLCDIRWSPDGRWLATGGFSDRIAKIWDARTGAEMHVLRRHTGPVLVVAFSSDSQRLATGGSDGKIEIWDAITGENVLSLDAHDTWLSGLAFSRRGDRLISIGRKDTAIKVWDARP